MTGGNFKCYRCKKPFRDHYALQTHYDRKIKCVPIGTAVPTKWVCEPCKQPFTTKGHYEAHLKTKTHLRMTASDLTVHNNNVNINNSVNTTNNITNNNITNNIQINLTPCDVSRLNYDYLPQLTAAELKKELGLDVKNLQETMVNTFKALHLSDDRTDNHSILLEFPNALKALIYKSDSWRLEDKARALNDCICQCAVHLLDLEHVIKECMDEREFKIYSMYRDEIERESAQESDDYRLKSLLDKVSEILAEFSNNRYEAVDHAKKQANEAAPLVYRQSQRFQEWLPGGIRYEAAWDNLLSSMG